jgi:hypothetical protein
VLCEPSSDSAGLLWSEIEGKVFLVLVEDAELRALACVDDGQNSGDGFAEVVTIKSESRELVPVYR